MLSVFFVVKITPPAGVAPAWTIWTGWRLHSSPTEAMFSPLLQDRGGTRTPDIPLCRRTPLLLGHTVVFPLPFSRVICGSRTRSSRLTISRANRHTQITMLHTLDGKESNLQALRIRQSCRPLTPSINRSGWIRTSDLLLPTQARSTAALRSEILPPSCREMELNHHLPLFRRTRRPLRHPGSWLLALSSSSQRLHS